MEQRIKDASLLGKGLRLASWLILASPVVGYAGTNYAASLETIFIQSSVNGVVTSSSGPLDGITVSVKGKPGMSTSTGQDGSFSIAAKIGETLVFTGVGYEAYSEVVSGTTMQIFMTSNEEALEEVVVVGYGTQKKESLTGALHNVKGDALRDVTNPSIENMLNGKSPGVYVSPGSSKPGSRGAVVIRGQATLSGSTAPLWVIDGVIVGAGAGDINPDDVESMTILKDAASTAIYGSQGANGVIVVTTKNAKVGKTTVSASTKMGFNSLNNGNMKMMNGQELYDYYASFDNVGDINFPRWNEDLRNSNFDWWDLATQNGFTQNHNIAIQGGNEKLQSYLSVGLYDEVGAVKGYDFTRYNFRLKTTYKPYKWLSIKPSLVGAKRDVDDRQYDVTSMYSNLPWDSPYDEQGNLVPHRYSGWVKSAGTNYLRDLQWNKGSNKNYEFMGNLDFDVKITNWLTFASVNNFRYNSYAAAGYTDPRSNGGQNIDGRITDFRAEYERRYTSQILRFNKTWGKHALNGVAGYEFNDFSSKTLDAYGTGFIPGFEVLDVVATPERTKGGITQWAMQSLLSNANYTYDGKYLAQVSFRRDGASNFGDNAKYGNFFSVSGGWNINRESWFKADWVDALKVRASYGSVGNRPSDLYPQFDLYSVSASSSYNGKPGALISQKGNRDLTWEKTYTTGVGADAAFLNNRARITLDYYVKDTDNILYKVPVTGTVGITSIWQNVGEMRNRGVELAIGGDIIRNEDWTWSLDVNLGHNTNKLTKLYPSKNADGTLSTRPIFMGDGLNIAGSAQRVLLPGLPVDTYYLKEWAGVNPDNGAPMWYVIGEDENGNPTRTTTSTYSKGTDQILDKASPDFFGGFSTFLRYKQFDLSAVFGYSIGGKTYNYGRQEYDADGTYNDRNQMKLQPGWSRWEKPGDNATHPIAKYGNKDQGNKVSSRYIESNDFLKMRSLTLGYNFKMKQYNTSNLRLFFAGENLFTITNYSGVDPELPALDGDHKSPAVSSTLVNTAGAGVYPLTRKFIFGFNVTF